MLQTIRGSLATIVSGGVASGSAGSMVNLASIGIDLQPDGTLLADNTKLTTALQSSSSTVQQIFNPTNGVAAQLNTKVNAFLTTGGIIDSRTTALNARPDEPHETDGDAANLRRHADHAIQRAVHRAEHADGDDGEQHVVFDAVVRRYEAARARSRPTSNARRECEKET